MDKGTSAYTEYEFTEDVIEYQMSNPERLEWKKGHIHSHNSMETFFSGTDMSELNDNSEFHNYYLSLIVNNAFENTAKVAFRGDIEQYSCKNEEGLPWDLKLKNKKQVLFTIDCEIEYEVSTSTITEEFIDRLKKIEEESKVVKMNQGYFRNTTKSNDFNTPSLFDYSEYSGRSLSDTFNDLDDFNSSFKTRSSEELDDTFIKCLLSQDQDQEMSALEDINETVVEILSDYEVAFLENVEDMETVLMNMEETFEEYFRMFYPLDNEFEINFRQVCYKLKGILDNVLDYNLVSPTFIQGINDIILVKLNEVEENAGQI